MVVEFVAWVENYRKRRTEHDAKVSDGKAKCYVFWLCKESVVCTASWLESGILTFSDVW